jgi:hypothetical protein
MLRTGRHAWGVLCERGYALLRGRALARSPSNACECGHSPLSRRSGAPIANPIRHATLATAEDPPETAMIAQMLDNKGTKILAKSLWKELRANGYSANQILGLTTELIELVTEGLREQNAAAAIERVEAAAQEARASA